MPFGTLRQTRWSTCRRVCGGKKSLSRSKTGVRVLAVTRRIVCSGKCEKGLTGRRVPESVWDCKFAKSSLNCMADTYTRVTVKGVARRWNLPCLVPSMHRRSPVMRPLLARAHEFICEGIAHRRGRRGNSLVFKDQPRRGRFYCIQCGGRAGSTATVHASVLCPDHIGPRPARYGRRRSGARHAQQIARTDSHPF